MKAAMEIEALTELSEEELIDRLGEVRRFMRDLKEENQNTLSLPKSCTLSVVKTCLVAYKILYRL